MHWKKRPEHAARKEHAFWNIMGLPIQLPLLLASYPLVAHTFELIYILIQLLMIWFESCKLPFFSLLDHADYSRIWWWRRRRQRNQRRDDDKDETGPKYCTNLITLCFLKEGHNCTNILLTYVFVEEECILSKLANEWFIISYHVTHYFAKSVPLGIRSITEYIT